MPGFFDKLSKGIGDTVDGIGKAVSDATQNTANQPAPPMGGAAPAPNPNDDFIDGLDPASWITPDDLGAAIEVPGLAGSFGAAQSFDRDEGRVARFASTDGAVTVDITSISEPFLERHGTQQAVLDALRPATTEDSWPATNTPFDNGLFYRAGPGNGSFVGCMADLVLRVEIYGPVGPELEAAAYNVAARCMKL